MKEVTVAFGNDMAVTIDGEVALDASENSLVILGDNGNYINFYWPNVVYYMVSDAPEEDSDE